MQQHEEGGNSISYWKRTEIAWESKNSGDFLRYSSIVCRGVFCLSALIKHFAHAEWNTRSLLSNELLYLEVLSEDNGLRHEKFKQFYQAHEMPRKKGLQSLKETT